MDEDNQLLSEVSFFVAKKYKKAKEKFILSAADTVKQVKNLILVEWLMLICQVLTILLHVIFIIN